MNRSYHRTCAPWSSAVAIAVFTLAGADVAAAQSPCGSSVTVSLGDTLNEIAANCGTTVSALVRANASITDPNLIHVGQVITIPGGGEPPPERPGRPDPDPPGARTHTVSPGETLAGIARRYGTSVSALTRANNIRNPNVIHVGQVIRIPGRGTPPPQPPREPTQAEASISPRSGPPGTRVRVTGSGFPVNADVLVGSGRARSEYDIVARTRADAAGRVDATAPVPDFADPGEPWVFVLVTEDRSVQARSGVFQVSSAQRPGEGRVQVTGVLTREGVECPALRDDDGELYTLAGDLGDFGPGDRVHVHGTVAEVSICQQGTTIRVESISRPGR